MLVLYNIYMESVLKSDVFFFITSLSVIVLTIGLVVILVYVIRILRNVDDVSETIKEESVHIREDLHEMRRGAKAAIPAGLRRFLGRMLGARRGTKRRSH